MTTTMPPRVPRTTFSLPGNTLLIDEALSLLHDLLMNLPHHKLRNALPELYHNYVSREHGNLPSTSTKW